VLDNPFKERIGTRMTLMKTTLIFAHYFSGVDFGRHFVPDNTTSTKHSSAERSHKALMI